MKGIKQITGVCIICLVTFIWNIPVSRACGSHRLYPLPIPELDYLIGNWLERNSFSTKRTVLPMRSIQLDADSTEIAFSIVLKPRSPLATEVRVSIFQDNGLGNEPLGKLWEHLDAYQNSPPADRTEIVPSIPETIMEHGQAVICIRTDRDNHNINLTGIVIENHGLILTTAHDLNQGENVKLSLPSGDNHTGRILTIDPIRDLALIHSDYQYQQAISIADGRNQLEMDERLYSIGCQPADDIDVDSGRINGPPRRANGQLLWQVAMEVVPGSSGRPVFDDQGTFVAMVKGRFRGVTNVGFLIPLETIIHFVRVSLQ